jgi:hypothetical protein
VIVLLVIFSIWVVVTNTNESFKKQKEYDKKLEELNKRTDSLGSEIFILNTGIMRYEIALEMLRNENPKAASEFDKQLSNTE